MKICCDTGKEIKTDMDRMGCGHDRCSGAKEMTTPTWHLERAKAVLAEWYAKAEFNLSLIDKYKITHVLLKSDKAALDGNCRRQALVCKTYGLIFHDQYKMMLDGCWRKSTQK